MARARGGRKDAQGRGLSLSKGKEESVILENTCSKLSRSALNARGREESRTLSLMSSRSCRHRIPCYISRTKPVQCYIPEKQPRQRYMDTFSWESAVSQAPRKHLPVTISCDWDKQPGRNHKCAPFTNDETKAQGP